MARYSDTVLDQNDAPVVGALITVVNQNGTVPTLTDDDGFPLTQPLTSDGYGSFSFNVDAGYYDLTYSYGGRKVRENFGVAIGDPIPAVTGPLVFDMGAQDADNPMIDIAQEWDNAAVDFEGEVHRITGTDYGSASVLMAYEFNGDRKLAIKPEGGVVITSGTVAQSDPMLDLSQTLDSGESGAGFFTGMVSNQDIVSDHAHPFSKYIDLQRNGTTVIGGYHGQSGGTEFVLFREGDPAPGGMRSMGTQGVMALTSGLDANSGLAAPVVNWYWEGGTNGSGYANTEAAVIRGRGTNRFSIESDNVLTFIADGSRVEFEGGGSLPYIEIFGYKAGTAQGRPWRFSNGGQTPSRADPLVTFQVSNVADKPFSWGTFISNTETILGYVDGAGKITSPGDSIAAGNGAYEVRESLTELVTVNASATTDTAIQVPAGARVDGYACRVTTTIPTASTFTVSLATQAVALSTVGAPPPTAANSTDARSNNVNSTSTQSIRITPDLTPAANTGRVRVVVWYTRFVAPTS